MNVMEDPLRRAVTGGGVRWKIHQGLELRRVKRQSESMCVLVTWVVSHPHSGLERSFLPEARKLAWNKTDKVKLLLIEKLEL